MQGVIDMTEGINFNKAIEELTKVGTLVRSYLDEKSGAVAKVDYTELTGLPQKVSVDKELDLPVPVGSIAEPQWRDVLRHNRNVRIGQKIFETIVPPSLNFLGNAATLFLFYEHEGFQNGLNDIIKTIVEEFSYTNYTMNIQYLTLGVPPPQTQGTPPFPPQASRAAHGAPYPTIFNRSFDYVQDPETGIYVLAGDSGYLGGDGQDFSHLGALVDQAGGSARKKYQL
jgi:hypothetical protein